jgi:hypothetical protein
MNLKSFAIVLSSLGLLSLAACNSGTPTATQSPAQTTSQSVATAPSPAVVSSKGGGMVVESGPYHLELLPGKEDNNTHLDFFLQKGDTHEPILGAKVTAQVQLPDGTKTSLDMIYDAPAKHYAAKVAGVAPGEYKVTIQSEIAGEKVNARYTFKH